TRELDGEVDEVSVYNRALSPGEIQSIFDAGADGKIKDMMVTSSIPAAGDNLSSPPTDFRIHFSFPLDPSTLQASDLTVNGISADNVAIDDPTTVDFLYDASPVSVAGPQTMQIAAGAIQATGTATDPALQPFTATFQYG